MPFTVTRFLPGALVLAAAGPLALAQSSVAKEGEAQLGPVKPAESAVGMAWANDFEVGALVRIFWALTDDDLGGSSFNGFDFHDIDIWAELPIENYDFRASFDADSGTARLEDAYVHYVHNDALAGKVGSFKPRVLFSNSVDPELLMFNERSVLGSFFDGWDIGAQASGRVLEQLDYFVSITNGANGKDSDSLYVVRGEWSFQGQDLPLQEGQHDLAGEQDIELGLVFFQDTGDNDLGLGADVLARFEKFALQFEVMSLDDGLSGGAGLKTVPVALAGDSLPWTLSGSTTLSDTMQLAGRIQSTDNADDTRIVSVALDYYPADGPVSLVAQIDRYDEDGDGDGFALQVGVSMGHSRTR
jgi:hypothetical protein